MRKQHRRLMVIEYRNQNDVDRLKTCLDMCRMPFVAIKECEFVGGGALWKIFIDRGGCSWEQVMREVNRVHPVKFRFVNDEYIENGVLHTAIYVNHPC